MSDKSCGVLVITRFSDGSVEQERVIDHNRRSDLEWLGKHCFWAMRNDRSVTTTPISSDEDEE